jgi:hypothetical protein
MPRPSHSSRFYHPNNIESRVQILKFLIMKFSPLRCYLVALRPTYSPNTLFSNTLRLRSSLNLSDSYWYFVVSYWYTPTNELLKPLHYTINRLSADPGNVQVEKVQVLSINDGLIMVWHGIGRPPCSELQVSVALTRIPTALPLTQARPSSRQCSHTYWLKSLHLTLAIVCAEKSQPFLVRDQ